jgi:hypothetical protein
MNYRILSVGCLVLFSSVATAAFVQNAAASSPDKSGDYYSNEAPAKGTAPSPSMAGSLWVVVPQKLNCRKNPGASNPIVKVFNRGDVIQAEVGRGGSDEVLTNIRDSSGKPWMWVKGGQNVQNSSSLKCYVRANNRYINPYVPKR